MKAFLFIFYVGICLYLQSGCSENVAGGGIETTNGASVSGQVRDSSGGQIVSARVYLRPQTYIADGSNVDSEKSADTDENGEYLIKGVPVGNWMIEASHEDGVSWAHRFKLEEEDSIVQLDTGVLLPEISISGVVTGPETDVYICGLGVKAKTDQNGHYTIDNVPPGNYLVKLVPVDSQYAPVEQMSVAGTVPDIVIEEEAYLLFDDFNDKDPSHRFVEFSSQGHWWIQGDNKTDGSILLPLGVEDDFSLALLPDTELGGYYTFVNMVIDTVKEQYAMVGLDIGQGVNGVDSLHTWYDFSGMKSLQFRAKGEGEISVVFISHYIQSNYSGASEFEARRTLDADWNVFVISPAELQPPDGSKANKDGVKWGQASGAICTITFMGMQNVELYLDDVRLNGVSPSILFRL
ncbi:MAG: carboxypeptidase regulatory-like domain-containing protein [Fibrobacteria bacterium]|nr:carboxypeptidase regulatory-like domain-containing protein [Fibrobacteria bacterium]